MRRYDHRDHTHVYGPTGRLIMDNPYLSEQAGPLVRTLRTLRRIKSLLDEPAKPEKRHIVGGSFSGNLFAETPEQDLLDLLDEDEDGPSVTRLPSLGEEWAGLLDRSFARVRCALRREGKYSQLEEVRFESPMGIPGIPVGGWRNMDGHNLSGILRELTRVSDSLEIISESLLRVETRDAEFEEDLDPVPESDDPAGTDSTGVDL